jgi:uncharacterized protein YoxC
MINNQATLQWLKNFYLAFKRHFDTLNTGGTLDNIKKEVAELGKTVVNFGQGVNQFKNDINSNTSTLNPTRTASQLISFAEYLDVNGFNELTDKVLDVIEISAQAGEKNLIKLADVLDKNECFALAEKVDEVHSILCMAENNGFFPRSRQDYEQKADDGSNYQLASEGSLSSRYCPDHRGVQAIRLENNTYQCPIDGKKYNYEVGYVNYEGKKVSGGSVAAQTPEVSDFGGIPMRYWDSRSDVLNRMN